MIARLTNAVRRCWFEAGLPGEVPRELSFLLSGEEAEDEGKVLVHVFRRNDPRPLLLVEIPREVTAHRWAQREYDFLRELAETAPDAAGSLFPRALFFEDLGNRVALGRTLLPGTRLDHAFAADGAGERASRTAYAKAQAWLSAFWSETGLLPGNEGALWEPFREAALFYFDAYDVPPTRRSALEQLVDEMETRQERTAPYALGHGNLLLANLLVDGRDVGAVDWEFGAKRQFPWVDALHFAIDASLTVGMRSGKGCGGGLEQGFLSAGWLADLNRDFLRDAFSRSREPLDSLRLALPATLLFSLHRSARLFSTGHALTRMWKKLADLGLEREAGEPVAA
jgi:hypothetical protein